MHKTAVKAIVSSVFFLGASGVYAQDLKNLIDDAVFFTDRYITPATDASVYQAASGWVVSPKEKKRWEMTLGLNFNMFFVPQRDRSFTFSNNDLSFFSIEGAESAQTPTALGGTKTVMLSGELDGQPVTLDTPEGVNRETILHPYLQGSLGLGLGTELVVRYSPKIDLKHVSFQVYGFGLEHSISQYFKNWETKKYHLAAFAGYSNEDVTVEFLDVSTPYGNLGLNGLNTKVDTWQFQLTGSKEYGKFELSGSVINDISRFKYYTKGERNAALAAMYEYLDESLQGLYHTQYNLIGEVGGRYAIGNVFVQSNVAFGKFVHTNFAVQYEF